MIWGIIIISGLITYSMRFIFLTPVMPARLSPTTLTAMRLVPIAVLWTIVTAEIFLDGRQIADFASNNRIIAAIGAGLIAYYSKSVILTIGLGMPLLWGVTYFFG